tara:strand:- start:63 stop:440 length:378 start_codon:yes stop_codon:yes gene_type:complete
MTTNEILEGNKLIAEFMGAKNVKDMYGLLGWLYEKTPNIHSTHSLHYSDENLEYHSSWDWLMPVVEKINTIDNYEYDVIIWRSDCHINNKVEIIFEGSRFKKETTLISVVWNCVVLFIQWYNSQQ